MTVTAEDRAAIGELLALDGHLFDAGELDRLDELFTESVVYDVSELGGGSLAGIGAIAAAALSMGAANPLGHHVTNIVVTESADGAVHAVSKGISVNADGTTGTVTYEDALVRSDHGWRISRRKVVPHRTPLGGRRADADRQRAGRRAVADYEAEHGPIGQQALDEADRLLDETGLD